MNLKSEEIVELIDQMEKESSDIRQEALRLAWYMRGGLTYDQALQLGSSERGLINDLIKANLETTKKTGLNFF